MLLSRFTQFLLVCFFAVSPALALDKDAAKAVDAALEQWRAAVESSSVDDIMKLYDSHAVMISSFAQDPMTKREQISAYYKEVVKNPDRKVKISDVDTRMLGSDVAVVSGLYTLSYTQEGEEVSVPARFTFVYQLEDGKWMIVNMHSSKVPLPEEKE